MCRFQGTQLQISQGEPQLSTDRSLGFKIPTKLPRKRKTKTKTKKERKIDLCSPKALGVLKGASVPPRRLRVMQTCLANGRELTSTGCIWTLKSTARMHLRAAAVPVAQASPGSRRACHPPWPASLHGLSDGVCTSNHYECIIAPFSKS